MRAGLHWVPGTRACPLILEVTFFDAIVSEAAPFDACTSTTGDPAQVKGLMRLLSDMLTFAVVLRETGCYRFRGSCLSLGHLLHHVDAR